MKRPRYFFNFPKGCIHKIIIPVSLKKERVVPGVACHSKIHRVSSNEREIIIN